MGSNWMTWDRHSHAAVSRTTVEDPTGVAGRIGLLFTPAVTVSSEALRRIATRRVLLQVLTSVWILGGMIAAPLIAIVAWAGVMLPEQVPLHRVSSTLFVIAIVWIATAIASAHLLHRVHEQGDS